MPFPRIKICPAHGEICWPVASIVCPVPGCGRELVSFDNEIDAALSLPDAEDASVPAAFPESLFATDGHR